MKACATMHRPSYLKGEARGQGKPHGAKRAPEENACASSDRACHEDAAARPSTSPEKRRGLLAFQEIYRSRDGKMLLFADERTGHLAAVDSSRLV